VQKGIDMSYIDAFYYALDRAKTQMVLYTQSNDSNYLSIASEYIKVAQIYLNNLDTNTNPSDSGN
jgi:hypothetical protein